MSAIKLGWASRDISTTAPVEIPGQAYARVSKGVLDPVTTTALVVDDGNDCAIFISVDSTSVRGNILGLVRERLTAQRADIPAEKLVMNATHIHTAPMHELTDPYFQTNEEPPVLAPLGVEVESCLTYRDFMADSIVSMIIEAWDKRSEGGIAYGYGYAVVAHSRRVCYFDDVSLRSTGKKADPFTIDGKTVMYGNTNDDNFSHYEAGADHFVNLMYTFDSAGNLTGAIVNVPCPSQNSEHEWYLTADYWNDVRVAIRKKHGDIFILPQSAAAGDLSPRILHYKKAQDRRFRLKYDNCPVDPRATGVTEMYARKDIAERIAAAFDEVLSWAKKDIRTEARVSHKVSTIELEKYLITDEDLANAKECLAGVQAQEFVKTDDPARDLAVNTRIVYNRNCYLDVIARYEEQKTETTVPMELHVLRIGDIAFAFNRFELYMDFQHRIQARSPFEQTFVIQLTSQPDMDRGSYLCTERAFEGRGYSASLFDITVSPKGGQQLVEATVKQLKELYAE